VSPITRGVSASRTSVAAAAEFTSSAATFGGAADPAFAFDWIRLRNNAAVAMWLMCQWLELARTRSVNLLGLLPICLQEMTLGLRVTGLQAMSRCAVVIELGSSVHADEAPHWDALHDRFLTKRINHEWAYSDEGACTNDAESFFSRVRRAEIGIHHHIAGPYFAAYVAEMAWREDNLRVSNGEQYLMTASAALKHPVSRQWKGYWQRAEKA